MPAHQKQILRQVVYLGSELKHQEGRGELKMARHQAKWFHCVMSVIPISQKRQIKLKEVKELNQGPQLVNSRAFSDGKGHSIIL